MRKFKHKNRYRNDVILEEIEKDRFNFYVLGESGHREHYWRFGGDNMEDLEFVDPSGGPFIKKGADIGGRDESVVVVKIEYKEDKGVILHTITTNLRRQMTLEEGIENEKKQNL